MHRPLQRSVGMEQTRRDQPDIGMPAHELDQRAQRARRWHGVGVERDDEVGGCAGEGLIHRARVAAVLAVADDPYAETRCHRDAVVVRRVVDDDHFGVEITEGGRECSEARPQVISRVPGHDSHANFGHSADYSCRSTLGLNP